MKRAFLIGFLIFIFSFSHTAQAKSGCCSWHGGVAGCDTSVGRQVCNDGTYSPSCTCAYVPPTSAPLPPTSTPIPPTNTPIPPTATLILPTNTPTPTTVPTATPTPRSEVLGTETQNNGSGGGLLALALLGGLGYGVYRYIKKRRINKTANTSTNNTV